MQHIIEWDKGLIQSEFQYCSVNGGLEVLFGANALINGVNSWTSEFIVEAGIRAFRCECLSSFQSSVMVLYNTAVEIKHRTVQPRLSLNKSGEYSCWSQLWRMEQMNKVAAHWFFQALEKTTSAECGIGRVLFTK